MADKKRFIPLVFVLAALVIGMGVFKFVSGAEPTPTGNAPSPTPPPTTTATTPDPEVQPVALAELPPRDPFKQDGAAIDPTPMPNDDPPARPPSAIRRDPSYPPMRSLPMDPTTLPIIGDGPPAGVTAPTPQPVEDPPPAFVLTGVVEGSQPVALIRDGGGGQRLARVNELLDGQFRVKTVSRKGVVISDGKRSFTLRLGGTAGEK